MKPQRPPVGHSEIHAVRLLWLAAFVSVFSFLFYQRHGDILLYGDAAAHINIARRIFDSKTPGLLQLGTVWLPLPHLLMLPFIVSIKLWQSGTGGSIPSMAGYILSVFGVFRLARTIVTGKSEMGGFASLMPWLAALLYGANPNLIYMQSTAMGESLYLAFFIWAVVYFAEFTRGEGGNKSLIKCALCLAAACLTRYDGWFLALVLIVAVLFIALRRTGGAATTGLAPVSRTRIVKFVLIAAAAPLFWLAYNAAVFGNAWEFENGPYSAKAIEQQTETVNPAKGNLIASGSYFLKAAELNVGEANWQGRVWLILAVVGSIIAVVTGLGRAALFLWTPLPFYALCIAYGSIPLFVPPWWPFSTYNVRYGIELLPAFAVFVLIAIWFLVQSLAKLPQLAGKWQRWQMPAALLLILVLASGTYAAIWRADPICFREAQINSRGRVALEAQLAKWFRLFPSDSTYLMFLGQHAGAFEQAGIPLRQVINETNHRVWKRPNDPEGLWERALGDPAAYADCIIGFEGDPVWNAAKAHHMTALVEIHTSGQPPAAIFQGRMPTPAR
jgi:hypothetical protein